MSIYPVVLCGGSGTRLWPASTPDLPKQFVNLLGRESMFVNTVRRFRGASQFEAPIVIAGATHVRTVLAQLRESGLDAAVIAEPEPRDSAPAIAVAALWIADRDPEGIAVVVAADHHIPDAEPFVAAVRIAASAAAQGEIVTFGVVPTEATSAYGYIRPGRSLEGADGVRKVEAFVEKPDRATAEAYVSQGFLWNSGNFVFKAAPFVEELDRHAPEVVDAARRALREARFADGGIVRLGSSFREAPKISIDYAVMEKTARAGVVPVSFGWSDLGAWDAVWAASERDGAGNALSGDAVAIGAGGCLVRAAPGRTVAAVGVSGLAIIAEGDHVLVCGLESAQGVKQAAALVGHKTTGPAEGAKGPTLSDLITRLDKWTRLTALPLWWAVGADHRRGGFYESIAQDGRPVDGPRRLRVQARQIYVYGAAAEQGWPGPAQVAVEHGFDYLMRCHRRSDGLFRTLVSADGEAVDDTAKLYDQAFVLLALASAHRVLGGPEFAHLAEQLLGRVQTVFAHDGRGFREESPDQAFQSNAHMHLLEACLAWEDGASDTIWSRQADAIVDLALERFIDPKGGFLREFFDAGWRPASGPQGRYLEPGHQFEWAWLLERWAVRRRRHEAHLAALRLFEAGCRGVRGRGAVAIDLMRDDFAPLAGAARLWPQTERLKASLLLAGSAGPEAAVQDCLLQARSAAVGLLSYLETPVPGLWRDRLDEQGAFIDEPAPASSFYHLMGAHEAACSFLARGASTRDAVFQPSTELLRT